MTRKIDNRDDVIDSRDVVARIDELQAEKDAHEDPEASQSESWADSDPDAAEELEQLQGWYRQLCDVGEDTPEDGLTLVRETYLVDYVKESYLDCMEPEEAALMQRLPFSCIDWKQVAEECRPDYTCIELGDVPYYVR